MHTQLKIPPAKSPILSLSTALQPAMPGFDGFCSVVCNPVSGRESKLPQLVAQDHCQTPTNTHKRQVLDAGASTDHQGTACRYNGVPIFYLPLLPADPIAPHAEAEQVHQPRH